MMRAFLLIAALFLVAAAPVTESPLVDDAQEARAQALFREIKCVVCAGESIAESPAEVAENLRIIVRERITAGDTDATIEASLVAQYGEQILMRPPFSLRTLLLWLAPLLLLAIGGAALVAYTGSHLTGRK